MIKLTDEAYRLMTPLLPELKEFYYAINGEKLGLVDLAVAIEQQFGARLSKAVCSKVKVSDAACLVLAIGMLRPVSLNMVSTAEEICKANEQVS